MKHVLLVAALSLAAPAQAQIVFSPIQSNAADETARSTAAAAQLLAQQAKAVADAASAAVPPACTALPAQETANGSIGTLAGCIRKEDASAKTTVMPASTTTAADGSFTGTWPATFTTAPTTAFASIKSTSDPFICQVGTATTTSFAGKCWRVSAMTLPGVALSLLNLVLVPYGAPPAGSTVMVVGRQ